MSNGTVPNTSCTMLKPKVIRQREEWNDELECSVHTLPKALLREFRHVFGDEYLNFTASRDDRTAVNGTEGGDVISSGAAPIVGGKNDNEIGMDNVEKLNNGTLELLAIPTNQRAREDLVATGDQVEKEKDRLLNVFISFGRDFCTHLRSKGYWADFIDPCSGLPMLTLNCNKVYSEVDGMECLLNYKSYNAGFCKILMHPKWGTSVYPATIFAYAPSRIVITLVQSYPSALDRDSEK